MPYNLKFTATFLQRKIGIVMNSDILIIGGGIIGLSIARELHRRGAKNITVVDKGSLGSEASFAAAGMLAPSSETEQIDDFYRLCSESNRLYPAFAKQIFDETGIDIEFDPSGTLYLAFNENDETEIAQRYDIQSGIGVNISRLSRDQILEIEPKISQNVITGILYPEDRQVENRKLLKALRSYLHSNQIKIVEKCETYSVLIEGSRAIGVKTENGEFRADHIILTTGAWTSLIKLGSDPMPFSIRPIRGQMMSFNAPTGQLKKVIYSPRGYLVPRSDGRILTGATVEDVGFINQNTEDGLAQLNKAAIEIAPFVGDLSITDHWSGLRPCTADERPILGQISGLDRLSIASGHYRNGILLAPLTAQLIADSVLSNVQHHYLKVFGPERSIALHDAVGK